MNKEDLLSILVYLGMLAIATVVGLTVLMPNLNIVFANNGQIIGFTIIALIVGIIVNAILVELMHLLGAFLGGYEVISFNIFGLCLYKTKIDNKIKWKFKAKNFDGLTGEVVAVPKKKKVNPLYSVFLPLILFCLEAVALYIVLILITNPSSYKPEFMPLGIVKYGVVIIATIGLMFALYDYFPAHIDSTTDGYKLVLFSKKVNIDAYNEFYRYIGEKTLGNDKATINTFEEITDYTSRINMINIYTLIDDNKFNEAITLLNAICADPKKISKNLFLKYKANLMYIYFLTHDAKDSENQFKKELTEEIKTYIIKSNELESLKTYLLFEGLIEKSKSEVNSTVSKFKKLYKHSEKINKDNEEILFNKAMDKLKEAGIEIE